MKNRVSGILTGSFLILTGLIFYFKDIISINFNSLIMFIAGILFIILYIFQNRKLSLIWGIYLICFSGVNLAEILLFKDINKFFYSAGGFICCSGFIFDVIYIRERKPGQLTAGLALTGTGVFLMCGLPLFDIILSGIGISLISNSIAGRKKIKTIETLAGIFAILTGLRSILYFESISRVIITLIFIVSEGILIFKSILKEKNNGR